MNYYRHHIGDYLRDTAHLSMLEDAAYRRLLDLYYIREQPIPVDIDQAARLIRAREPAERAAVVAVLTEFFTLSDDGWHQKRADLELAAAHDAAERARQNGRRGGRKPGSRSRPTNQQTPAQTEPTKNPEETQSVISGIAKPNPEESSPPSTLHPSSVTNVTAAPNGARAVVPIDAQSFVMLHGLAMLMDAGKSERASRSYLGKCLSAYGPDATANAVRETMRCSAADPVPYLQKIFANLQKPATAGSTRKTSLADDLNDTSWAQSP